MGVRNRELDLLSCFERLPTSSSQPVDVTPPPTCYFCPYPNCDAQIVYLPLFQIHLNLHEREYQKYYRFGLEMARSAAAVNNLQRTGSKFAAASSTLPMAATSSATVALAHALPPLPNRPRVPAAAKAKRVVILPKQPRPSGTLSAPPRARSDVVLAPKARSTEDQDNPLELDLELRL